MAYVSQRRCSLNVNYTNMPTKQDATRKAQAEALLTLLRHGRASRDSESFVTSACEQAREVLGADFAALLSRSAGGGYTWLGVAGNRTDVLNKRNRGLGRGPAATAIAQERTVVFGRAAKGVDGSLEGLEAMRAEGAQLVLAIPLRDSLGAFGSLVFGWRSEVGISPEQRGLAETLGEYVAVVLDNTTSHSESERRRSEAQALAELVRQGATERSTSRVIELICEQAAKLSGGDYAGIRLLTEAGELEWAGMWGNRTEAWRNRSSARGTGSASQAVAAGHTLVTRTPDMAASGLDVESGSVRAREGGVVVLATPLTYGGRGLGALVVGWRSDVTPSGEQVRVAEVLAGYGAAVIDNANSHAESERRRAEAEALAELVRLGAAEHDPDHAIALICERGRDLLGADYVTVSLVEEGGQRRIWHGLSGTQTPWSAATRGRGSGPTAQALEVGRAIVFERLHEKRDFSRLHASQGGRTAIAAPCIGRRGLRGALHIGWCSDVTITPSQLRQSEALAGYAAEILENANAHAALEERAAALAASEDRFRKLSEELEQRVIERTAELEAANKELEAFSYSVSHDLRAPLRSMDGFCQVLLEDYGDRLDDEGRDYLHRVRSASQRLAELIDGLLGLSRVTRTRLKRQRIDLSTMAEGIVRTLQETEPERNVDVRIQPRLAARGDPRLLTVVLDNLLRNAWKFSAKHDSARIEFGTTQVDGETAFFVRDDGAGFDMAFQDKLFGPFQRLHGMTEFEGTGIGLATVQRIVNRHGGRVWAEAQIEHGATFYFTLSDGATAVSSSRGSKGAAQNAG